MQSGVHIVMFMGKTYLNSVQLFLFLLYFLLTFYHIFGKMSFYIIAFEALSFLR